MEKKWIFFVSLFALWGCEKPNEDIKRLSEELRELAYEDRIIEADKVLNKLKSVCNPNIEISLYIYCKSDILHYENLFIDSDSELKANEDDFKELISTGIEREAEQLTIINAIDSFLIAHTFQESHSSYFDEIMTKIKPVENSSYNYISEWNILFSKIKNEELKFDEELEFLNTAIKYQKLDRQNLGVENYGYAELYTLERKVYALMNLGNFYESKLLTLEIIKNTSLDIYPTFFLEGWSILSLLEKIYGSVREEYVYSRIFIEKYYQAVLNKGIWNSEIDDLYIHAFDDFIYMSDCNSIYESLEKFIELSDIRYEQNNDFEMPYFIDLAINRELLNCAENENDRETFAYIYDEQVRKLNEILDYPEMEFIDNIDLASIGIYISQLDVNKKSTTILFKKFEKVYLSYIALTIQQYDQGILTNDDFSPLFVDNLISTLTLNIEALNEEEFNRNINYIDFFLEKLFLNNYLTEKISAYEDLFINSTYKLHILGFEQEALYLYNKYFVDNKFTKVVDPSQIFDTLDFLAMTNIYMLGLDGSSENNINKILQRANSVNRSSLEISLVLNKSINKKIRKFIRDNIKKDNLSNKFIASIIDESELNKNELEEIIEITQKTINQSSKLNSNLVTEINKILNPKIRIDDLQKRLDKNESVVLLYKMPNIFTTMDAFFIAHIEKSSTTISTIKHPSIDIDYLLNNEKLIYQTNNNVASAELTKKLNKISNIFFGNFFNDFLDKKHITFITNLDDAFNADLIRYNNRWLIEKINISNKISLSSFFNERNTTQNNSYIGIGGIDYSNHKKNYSQLNESVDEIKNASKKFKNFSHLFERDGSLRSLQNTKMDNSVIHFATHNSYISKNGFEELPALVIAKEDNDDGYFDAFEIQEVNFTNSDIILSACKTFLSLETTSVPFTGLIKSFKYAGARSIMATRWEIESISAAIFSSKYAQMISMGYKPSEAGSIIKREFIYDEKYSHPFYWSGYLIFEF